MPGKKNEKFWGPDAEREEATPPRGQLTGVDVRDCRVEGNTVVCSANGFDFSLPGVTAKDVTIKDGIIVAVKKK